MIDLMQSVRGTVADSVSADHSSADRRSRGLLSSPQS